MADAQSLDVGQMPGIRAIRGSALVQVPVIVLNPRQGRPWLECDAPS